MADTKTFQTAFRINAVWAGQPGVQKAQRALGGLQKTAKAATTHFRGMASSVFKGMAAYGVASKAAAAFTNVLIKSVTAAEEAQEAHDELFTTIERMAKRYKSTAGKSVAEVSAIVEESTQALIKASEQMEQTGHDAETLQKGWAKLAATGALDPKQILEQRDAFSDVLSYINGANATAEESAALGEAWADAILRGNLALAKQMDLSTGEIELVRNITKLEKKGAISGEEAIKRRQALFLKFAKKFEGETIRVFGRPSGKVAQMWIQVSNVLEELGKPFIGRAPELAESFKKIAVEVKPIAEELAKIAEQSLKDFSGWLKEGGAATVVKNIGDVIAALKTVEEWLNKINTAFTFKQSIWQWLQTVGEPAKRPTLPGSPSQEPITGGAGTGGEAERRKQQAIQRGEEEAKAEAEAAKAVGAGWSTEPAKILRGFKIGEEQAAAAPGPTQAAAVANAQRATSTSAPASGDAVAALDAKLGGRLKGQAATIFAVAAKHGVDPYLLAAIAQVESAKGTSYSIRNRNAPVGMMDPRNPQRHQSFASLEAGLEAGAALLKRGYISQGRTTPASIGAKWTPPGAANDPNRTNALWPGLVTKEMARLKADADAVTTAVAKQTAPSETIKKAEAVAKTAMQKSASTRDPFGVQLAHPSFQPAPPPPPKPLQFPKTSLVPAGSSLKDLIKEMNLQQRVAGATGGQNIAMNAPITINGVAPGRESLVAKKMALALRDPTAQLLAGIKEARAQEARLGYV